MHTLISSQQNKELKYNYTQQLVRKYIALQMINQHLSFNRFIQNWGPFIYDQINDQIVKL